MYLFFLLSCNGGGDGSLDLCLEVVKLRFEGEDCIINLLLVVSVYAGEGEDADPGEGDDGQSIHEGSNIGEQVHGNRKLQRFDNIFHQQDRLEFCKDAIQLVEKSISDLSNLFSGESNINVKKLLEGVSLLGLVYSGEDGLVDPETHGGGDQSQGEVTNHADEGNISDSKKADEDRATGNARVSGVVPVKHGVHLVWVEPHLGALLI